MKKMIIAKNKAIIGIAVAMVMVASVFATMVPAGRALSPEEKNVNQGDEGYIDLTARAGDSVKILRGQTLNFSVCGKAIYGYSEDTYGKVRGTTSVDYDTEAEFSTADAEYAWFVDVVPGDAQTHDSGYNSAVDVIVSLEVPRLDIEIEDEAGKSIVSTTVGKDLRLDISHNLFADDKVDIMIKDPDGHIIETKNISMKFATNFLITTGGWKTGMYEIWVETTEDGGYARGLELTSNRDDITLYKGEIRIEAETTTPSEEEEVLFTVRAPPYTLFSFDTTHPEDVEMTQLEDNPRSPTEPGEVAYDDVAGTFTGMTDEDGHYTFVTRFIEDRRYTFAVESDLNLDGVISAEEEDDIDIDVKEIEVTFDVPITVPVGEDVIIRVVASAGDSLDIVIDDILEFDDEVLIDGVAEVEWDTTGKAVKTYTIEVFVDCDLEDIYVRWREGCDVKDIIDDEDIDADGIAMILLVEPGVNAKQLTDEVAAGDDYVVNGTATGVDEVDIVIIGPYGLTEAYLGIEEGLEITTASVSGDEYEEDIDIPDASDAGEYVAIVLTPGRDGEYRDFDGIEDGEFDKALKRYEGDETMSDSELAQSLRGKSQAQLIAIVGDASFDYAGSDDQYAMLTFSVAPPYIEFVPIESVKIGEPLDITGRTNREPGTLIALRTVEGPTMLPPAVTEVEWPTPDQGIFTATFDTTYAVAGIYTLEAEDGKGNNATATVTIHPAVSIFDTGAGTYPSISGTHIGTITPSYDINVSTLYTYACTGTGGHTEYAAFYNAATGEAIANARWNGYHDDYRYIEFDAPFTLRAKVTYNYTLKTGSYPQIIHAERKNVIGGVINCTEFIDANGKRYSNWIPAMRLE